MSTTNNMQEKAGLFIRSIFVLVAVVLILAWHVCNSARHAAEYPPSIGGSRPSVGASSIDSVEK